MPQSRKCGAFSSFPFGLILFALQFASFRELMEFDYDIFKYTFIEYQ